MRQTRTEPTAEQLEDWSRRVFSILSEAEETYGDNAAGTYPKPVEMHLWLTHSALRRAARELLEKGPDLPPPTREELFTSG